MHIKKLANIDSHEHTHSLIIINNLCVCPILIKKKKKTAAPSLALSLYFYPA